MFLSVIATSESRRQLSSSDKNLNETNLEESLPPMQIRDVRQNIQWLAGLLDGRGAIEVGRYDVEGRRKILPDICVDFGIKRREVAEEAARIMGGITIVARGGQRVHAFLRGWRKVSTLAEELLSLMKDPAKVDRLERIVERSREIHPSVCREAERNAERDRLSEVFFRGCQPPVRDCS